METSIIRGISVTGQDIQRAIIQFDQMFPHDSNAYDSWLEKDNYKWALHHKGRLYPHKYILSLATGMDTTNFIAAEARRVFGNLGFQIISKP